MANQDDDKQWKYLIILLLGVATLAVYWRVGSNGFVNLDDPGYVSGNSRVQAGLTVDNVRWAFTTFEMGNWHPLTWLSHMTDCQLYGLNPRGHHFTSVFLHIVNTVLLFLLFARMTGALWRSALVAALFALHPLHVESVAWVSERKDVLSALFFLLALTAYVRYVERPGAARYLAVCCAFALGLMAKPMVVTLPCVLLLLDYWPLGRWSPQGAGSQSAARLLLEKTPLLVLALISSLVTIFAQQAGEAVVTLGAASLPYRLVNALAAYQAYLGKTFWPGGLAVLYPLPVQAPVWQAAVALLLLGSVSVAVCMRAQRSPYLPVGWFWFLGTLVPVIGLMQVGVQAMADRYTYLPLIGLFIMIAWGVPELTAGGRCRRSALAAAAAVILSVCSAVSWRQIGHWKDSVELFTHTLKHTSGNFTAHLSLGIELVSLGRTEEAISHYSKALLINPDNYMAHLNLGVALAAQGRNHDAIRLYNESLRLNPDCEITHFHLGVALLKERKVEETLSHFSEALRINPDYIYARYNLGVVLTNLGRTREAISQFTETLRLQPDFAEAHENLGLALAREGRLEEAVSHLSAAVRLNPADPDYNHNLAVASTQLGKARQQRRP